MKKYDFMNETVAIENYEFPKNSNQEVMAKNLGATRILHWSHDSRGRLPNYVMTSINAHGYTVEKIGYTTYVSNTFGLIPKKS